MLMPSNPSSSFSPARTAKVMADHCRLAFPNAILQLAWRPSPPDGDCSSHILAAAGEDSSLRLFAFDEVYLRPLDG